LSDVRGQLPVIQRTILFDGTVDGLVA
jgi:hypothetical protein